MPHQLEGVCWLFGAFGRGGGLLADEPGLGKTLQVIVLLEALVRTGRVARVLIAAPANLCVSAFSHLRTFTPTCRHLPHLCTFTSSIEFRYSSE